MHDHWDAQAAGHSNAWDFGDGDDSRDDDPLHCYATAATYQVRLVVSNRGGSDECQTLVTP